MERRPTPSLPRPPRPSTGRSAWPALPAFCGSSLPCRPFLALYHEKHTRHLFNNSFCPTCLSCLHAPPINGANSRFQTLLVVASEPSPARPISLFLHLQTPRPSQAPFLEALAHHCLAPTHIHHHHNLSNLLTILRNAAISASGLRRSCGPTCFSLVAIQPTPTSQNVHNGQVIDRPSGHTGPGGSNSLRCTTSRLGRSR